MAEYSGKKYGDNGVKITTAFSLNNMPLDFRSVCGSDKFDNLKSDCYPGLTTYKLDENRLYYTSYNSANDTYTWKPLADHTNHYKPGNGTSASNSYGNPAGGEGEAAILHDYTSESSTGTTYGTAWNTSVGNPVNLTGHAGASVISGIYYDDLGHVTGITCKKLTSESHWNSTFTVKSQGWDTSTSTLDSATAISAFNQQSATDVTLIAGNDIQLTADTTNRTITIDNTYTEPTYYWANLQVTEGSGSTDTSPTFNVCTANSFHANSDARLKENIQDFIPEKSILDLPVKKFDFKNGKKNQIGCIAQDLQEICPELVYEKDDGFLSIQESKLIYLLLDEVKKLKKEVEELKKNKK